MTEVRGQKDAKGRLVDALVNQDGVRLLDLKFLRGSNNVISEAAFAEQVLAVVNQRRLGLAETTDRFEERLHVVDLKDLMANL